MAPLLLLPLVANVTSPKVTSAKATHPAEASHEKSSWRKNSRRRQQHWRKMRANVFSAKGTRAQVCVDGRITILPTPKQTNGSYPSSNNSSNSNYKNTATKATPSEKEKIKERPLKKVWRGRICARTRQKRRFLVEQDPLLLKQCSQGTTTTAANLYISELKP